MRVRLCSLKELQTGIQVMCTANIAKKRLMLVLCQRLPKVALDPGPIPQVLNDLNKLERRFIALIHVFMTLYVLPGNSQLGERGMAINFPVTPDDFISQVHGFPLIAVKFNSTRDNAVANTHLISPRRVHEALCWLKENNLLYKHIVLPALENVSTEHNTYETIMDETKAVLFNVNAPSLNFESALHENIPHHRIPISTGQIIDAYGMQDGEEMAFPWLFCFGKNGYMAGRIRDPMFPSMYFKARFMHKNGRWRKDMTYLFHASNFYERRLLHNSVKIHMRMMKNTRSDNLNGPQPLTANDIFSMSNNEDLSMKFIHVHEKCP